MSVLSDLLNRAMENKSGKNFYRSGLWSVAFEDRAYETLFWVYYNRIPVLSGTTWDKSVELCSTDDDYPYDKLIQAVKIGLPEYHLTGEVYDKYLDRIQPPGDSEDDNEIVTTE